MKNRIFFLLTVLFISFPSVAERVIDLPDLLNPHLIKVSRKLIFIADGTHVYIYSLSDFHLIKKFGRAGEGPGELKSYISDLEAGSDFILVNSIGRLSWFNHRGEFIKQKNDTALGVNYRILGNGFVGMRMKREKKGIFFSVNIFDSELNILCEIYDYRHPFFNPERKINPVNLRVLSYTVYGNQIYLCSADGVIQVFDPRGNILYSATPKISPVELTPELREKYLEFWKSDLKAEYEVLHERFDFQDFFPLIKDFRVAGGRIYVITYREKGRMNEMFILDLLGNQIAKTWVELADVNMLLPHLFNYYTIQDKMIYKLVDNPDREIWQLRVFELDK